jgi:hypothetical protein
LGAGHLVLNVLQMMLCTLGVGCVNLYDGLERSAAFKPFAPLLALFPVSASFQQTTL